MKWLSRTFKNEKIVTEFLNQLEEKGIDTELDVKISLYTVYFRCNDETIKKLQTQDYKFKWRRKLWMELRREK